MLYEPEEGEVPSYILMDPKELKFHPVLSQVWRRKPETRAQITGSMKSRGYDAAHPVVAWNLDGVNYVVDGHTRVESANKAQVGDVPVVFREFADVDDAVEYAVESQRFRRNLTDEEILRAIAALDKRKREGRPKKTGSDEPVSGPTAERTAGVVGTSPAKVKKGRRILDQGTDEEKKAVLEDGASINAVEQKIRERTSGTADPRRKAEKWENVRNVLYLHPDWENTRIAENCGVSRDLVRKVRKAQVADPPPPSEANGDTPAALPDTQTSEIPATPEPLADHDPAADREAVPADGQPQAPSSDTRAAERAAYKALTADMAARSRRAFADCPAWFQSSLADDMRQLWGELIKTCDDYVDKSGVVE